MKHEQQLHLQRPDLGVESVKPANPVLLSQDQFPWLSLGLVEVTTVLTSLDDGETTFRYGSIVNGNHSVEKLASEVPQQQSLNAEQGMFKGLSLLLNQKTAPNIESVPLATTNERVYKTTKKGNDAARLFFTTFRDDNGKPVVIKLGIASHKKQQELMGILGRTGSKRRKKDGGSR